MKTKLLIISLIMALSLVCAGTVLAEQLSGPVLLTSAGQSPDVVMAKVLMRKAGITADFNQTAQVADLDGYKTLIFVIGASSKGLGAAGINFEDELSRVKELVDKASEQGIAVLAMHLGGSSRRGDSSNTLIEAIVPQAATVIVVEDGNKDGIFDRLLADGADMRLIPRIADAVGPLGELIAK